MENGILKKIKLINRKCDLNDKSLFEVLENNLYSFFMEFGVNINDLDADIYERVINLLMTKDTRITTDIIDIKYVSFFSKKLGLEFTIMQNGYRLLGETKKDINDERIRTIDCYQVKKNNDNILVMKYKSVGILDPNVIFGINKIIKKMDIDITVNDACYSFSLDNTITYHEYDLIHRYLGHFNYSMALELLNSKSMNNSTNR